MWTEEVIEISNIKEMLEMGYEIEVDSPDGFVPVDTFVEKGKFEEYVLSISGYESVRCNEDHLFETKGGWKYAKDLDGFADTFLTKDGWKSGIVNKTENIIPIVDINVDHPNHRYYTNEISSHNTNVGKSMVLISLAADYIRNGIDVFYISMEMREEEIFRRIDANLLGCSIAEVSSYDKDKYTSRLESLKKRSYGNLKVKAYPPVSANTVHFQHILRELNIKKGFKPKVLIVDYLGIVDSSRIKASQGSYFYLKSVSEELRALAVDNDVVLWSAVQVNREGIRSSDFELTDIAESSGIAHTADFMMGIIRTEELDAAGQLLFKQLKNRYSNRTIKSRFTVGVNLEMQKIFDISESSQSEIVVPEEVNKRIMSSNIKDKFRALNGG